MSYLFIYFLVIEFLILGLFKEVSYAFNFGMLITLLNIFINIFFLLRCKNKFKLQITISYIIRCLIMYFDVLGRNVFVLPISGGDTFGYYKSGLIYGSGNKIIGGKLYGELYSKFIGVIFRFIGDQRIFVQYINVVLSILTIFIFINILNKLGINYSLKKNIIWIISLFPMNIMISSVLLRESIIIFLSTYGIYFYVNYTKDRSTISLLLSVILIIIASMFHSGIIMLLIGIIYYELFTKANKFGIFRKTFFITLTIILLLILKNKIFDKFIYQKSLMNIYDGYLTEAGSRYLPNIYINSLKSGLKFGWIKALYFISSPTPLYWRGILDVITFFTDSIIYIYILVKILVHRNISENIKMIYNSLLLSLLATVFTFGIGTSSAGTAMRHRNKLIILFLIIYCISENYNKVEPYFNNATN